MKPDRNQRIEEILASVDGAARATAPSFFYTRLKARMQAGLAPAETKPLVLRPVFVIASLLVILLLNVFVMLNSSQAEETMLTEIETEQSLAAEYSINTNLTYELNQ